MLVVGFSTIQIFTILHTLQFRPKPKPLSDDERFAPNYMIVDRPNDESTGWNLDKYMYDGAPGFEEYKSLGKYLNKY